MIRDIKPVQKGDVGYCCGHYPRFGGPNQKVGKEDRHSMNRQEGQMNRHGSHMSRDHHSGRLGD